ILFNGYTLRLIDPNRLYARRFVDIDLPIALQRPDALCALWRLARSRALVADSRDPESLHALIAASERHSAGVCKSLRSGVLAASGDILQALIARHAPRDESIADSFEQALTIVYRILFLLFAEARALVPVWHPV